MDERKVSRSAVIAAPAEKIFAIIADPRRHPDIDGSAMVRGNLYGPERLEAGSTFGMSMRLLGIPYRTRNRVVEYEPDRRIAWRHFGPHRWRWELEPVDENTTRVTETFDYSHAGPYAFLYRLVGYPSRNARAIEASLQRLKQLLEA
ncbi:SRPBCC family protein [Thermobifida cellulosilytica]|uniref:Dimethyladenosine transferase n=1 Tax=Thermobifida cellulosilytica TB100 TaxID=665004 RepID=A0A147KGC2_THECS|nr:SRPBCC family protein [Thermobifida cellulosilytica]KUP96351.1 dimethyladenosine transferase [Thermobifida cellulosilytica TB100]